MKTKPIILFFFLFIAASAFAQTATSVANGNWTSPMTWSCSCVPTPGYTVVINHNVTLNTSFAYTSGSITINSGGSLVQDSPTRDIWVNGGGFTNAGSVDVRFILTQAGTFSNSGTMTFRALANYVNFTNTGTVQNVDSLYNASVITNNGSFLNIDSITNAGTYTNNGTSVYNQFTNSGQYDNNNNLTFTDITNNGTLTNADTITALNSGWNQGNFILLSNSYFLVTNGFLNDDITLHDAVLDNNGRMNVLDSWYNFDTIKGVTGSFIIQDSTVNYGAMKQSFDFCDLTPPASAPYVDFNFGTVSTGITWCVNTSVSEQVQTEFRVFPNPATSHLCIQSPGETSYTVELFDAAGNLVRSAYNTTSLNITGIDAGLYMIVIYTSDSYTSQRVIIE